LAAGFHHQPAAVDEAHRQLVTLVYIADTICCQAGHGFSLTATGQTIDGIDLAAVGLDSAIIEEVATTLPQLLADASSIAG
jgi:hypothetical protein